MSKRNHFYQAVIVVLLLAMGWAVVAGDGKRSPETDLAAPGAPLYEYAVTESVKTMMSKQEQAKLEAKGRPPSPGPDYYWCKNCKTYHKRQTPASAQQPAATAARRPPSPGASYYWCEQCKTYHRRKPVAQQPVADPSRILGGVSNTPNQSPLISPAGAER